jgi:hypothetical protein
MARPRTSPAVRRALLGAVAVLALASTGLIGGVSATSNAVAKNPGNVFATTALYAPSNLTAAVTGHNVALGWAAGTNGSAYTVLGAANGSSSNCSAATYATVATTTSLSYTDTSRYTPQGTWYCYQVQTSYGSWTSVASNPVVAARIGFFASGVTITNGGTAGRLDTGDTIVVTFGQPVSTASGPSGTNTVCSTTAGVIQLGATTTTGTCSAGEAVNLGALKGGSTTVTGRWSATYTWSNSNQTLTIVLGTRVTGTATVVTSGTWTFNPSTTTTKLLSATGAFHVCDTNSGGGVCLPTATGSF